MIFGVLVLLILGGGVVSAGVAIATLVALVAIDTYKSNPHFEKYV